MTTGLIQAIRDLTARVAEMERKSAASSRRGVVAEVDAAAGTVRLDLGDGMLSPAIPYGQFAGALKIHTPPTVGQLMTLTAPSGEMEQGLAIPTSFGGGNDAPSSASDANAITFGSVRIDLDADAATVTVGGVSLVISASGVAITGGRVTHNGTDIGDTHRHGGVDRGSGTTNPPE